MNMNKRREGADNNTTGRRREKESIGTTLWGGAQEKSYGFRVGFVVGKGRFAQ